MFPVYQYVLAVMLVIDAANCLSCYTCNSQESLLCHGGSSVSTRTLGCGGAGYFENEISHKCYTITAQSKDGNEYIARGCLPQGNIGCSSLGKSVGWVVAGLKNLTCDICETDKCNGK